MPREKTVLYRREGRIARITLNRPEVLNAEDMTFLADLTEAVHTLRDDREVQVAIVTGAGRAWELLLLGDTIGARRALEIGLVNAVVPQSDLEARCLAMAERFLAVPHTSLVHIKRLSNLAFQADFAHFMQAFIPAQQACLASPEFELRSLTDCARRGCEGR